MRKVEPKTEDYMTNSVIPGNPKKGKDPVKTYPRLRLEHQFFPEAKSWKVGKTYKVEMEIKMTGLSISKYQNDSEFDIVGFGAGKEKSEEEEKE